MKRSIVASIILGGLVSACSTGDPNAAESARDPTSSASPTTQMSASASALPVSMTSRSNPAPTYGPSLVTVTREGDDLKVVGPSSLTFAMKRDPHMDPLPCTATHQAASGADVTYRVTCPGPLSSPLTVTVDDGGTFSYSFEKALPTGK